MADLKTTYKDDVLNTSANEKRKYNMIPNEDGTVSLEDVTEYSQVGDSFGAADINKTNTAVNQVNADLSNIPKLNDVAFIVTLPFTAPKDGILYLYGEPSSGGSFYAYYEIKNSKGDNVFSDASAHSDLYTLGGWATNVHMHEITLKKGDTVTAFSIGGNTTSYIYSFR